MTKTPRPRKSPAERDAEIKALTDLINAKIADLVASGRWADYVHFASRFHNYSINNVFLLWAQAEQRGITLTRVAGFRAWQGLGRQVRRGEKSFKVIAPRPFLRRNDDGSPLVDPDTGEQVRGMRFGTESVFDVSQTDGEPLPEAPGLPAIVGDGPAGLWDALAAQAAGLGYTVTRADLPTGTKGRTEYTARTVIVDGRLGDAEAVHTLAHEIGHIRAEHETRRDEQGVTREQREAEADTIAAIVCTTFGLDTTDFAAAYLAGWTDADPKILSAAFARIQSTAKAMIGDIEAADAPAADALTAA